MGQSLSRFVWYRALQVESREGEVVFCDGIEDIANPSIGA